MRPETTSVVETRWHSGLGNLGPFVANYTAQATPMIGVASAASLELHLSFDIDLRAVLPDFSLPPASVDMPDGARLTTPATRIVWPTVTVRLSHRDCVIGTHEPVANAASLLAAIALAVSDVMLDVPFGAPLLAVVLDAVLTAIGVEGTARFLHPILTSLNTGRAAVVPTIDVHPAGCSSEEQQLLEPAWA